MGVILNEECGPALQQHHLQYFEQAQVGQKRKERCIGGDAGRTWWALYAYSRMVFERCERGAAFVGLNLSGSYGDSIPACGVRKEEATCKRQ